ncbi:DUF4097 domain-containing protein [Clostridium sp. LY3-2]|uniref:DUF4097 family beta strand repeat-containing protein n=1 Tax=Clostridium sp. LY3-2 TaxID=2942482 RepID=UPI002152DFA3|nr:DUF4097 domain-containing protein [Clostridium sp. LY3-2]MCR6513792.1 DUF4097 domain-containing protein [Clostridium sp. LY3-2]
MSKKPLIKKKFKFTMLGLLIASIISFLISFTILYSSDYKLSNYTSYFEEMGYSLNDFLTNGEFSVYGFKYNKTGTFDLFKEDVDTINFNSGNYDIHLYPSGDYSLKTYFSAKGLSTDKNPLDASKWNFKYDKKDKTLNISLDVNIDNNFNTDHSNYNIDFYIPTKYKNKIKINSTSGNINIFSNSENNLDLASDSGRISVDSVNEVTATTRSGNIDLDGHIKKFTVSSDSGNITNFASDYNFGKIKSKSGDVNSSLYAKNSLDIKTESGNITLDTHGDIYPYSISAETKSGNISNSNEDIINSPYRINKGKIKINVNSHSGNITFNQ